MVTSWTDIEIMKEIRGRNSLILAKDDHTHEPRGRQEGSLEAAPGAAPDQFIDAARK
jgi:hypothetical protein